MQLECFHTLTKNLDEKYTSIIAENGNGVIELVTHTHPLPQVSLRDLSDINWKLQVIFYREQNSVWSCSCYCFVLYYPLSVESYTARVNRCLTAAFCQVFLSVFPAFVEMNMIHMALAFALSFFSLFSLFFLSYCHVTRLKLEPAHVSQFSKMTSL